ncbi:MliC family protein [Microbulbifer taiwanensis]|uniref:MliC family protein n=1 Tax=Microbulbifer taiwanensis TaxID=986746 RepID=A0ABW1YLV1_9GAMM|nr:MliC family protein [Microbulbifer taiwanensis]
MSRFNASTLTAGLFVLVSAVACEHGDSGFQAEIKKVDYLCENGQRLQLKYVTPHDGEPGLATLTYRNAIVPMHQERAASGVLYVADKGQPGYRWHTKGEGGVLLMHSLGNGEEEVVLRDCRSTETRNEGN